MDAPKQVRQRAHTGEFFRRLDAWRREPQHQVKLKHALPGLGTAIVAFTIYVIAEQIYERYYETPHTAHDQHSSH